MNDIWRDMNDIPITEQARALIDAEPRGGSFDNAWQWHQRVSVAAPTIIAGLLAELDARTDPALATRLNHVAEAMDGDECYGTYYGDDLRAAAQMIGGEQ